MSTSLFKTIVSRFKGWLPTWGIHSIGVTLFIYIVIKLDAANIIKNISTARLSYIVAGYCLTFPFLAAKSFRWRIVLEAYGIFISYGQASILYLIGLFTGHATPGQIGELARVYYLRRLGHSSLSSGMSILIDRLSDIMLLIILNIPIIWIFKDIVGIQVSTPAIFMVFLIFTTAIIIFIVFYKEIGFKLGSVYEWFIQKFEDKTGAEIKNNLFLFKKIPLFSVAFLTVISYAFNFFRLYLLLVSLDVRLPLLYLVSGLALVSLISLLPISVAGMGTRDITLIAIFSHLGIRSEIAISYSFLILGLYLFQFILGFFSWSLYGFNPDKKHNFDR